MKSITKILCSIIILLLFSQMMFAQWQGAGTEQNPFRIYNLEDLEKITNHQLDNNYLLNIGVSYTDVHFEIMNDIEYALTQRLCENFNGYLHGRGHYITLDFHNEDLQYNMLIFNLYGTIDSLTFIGDVSNFYSLIQHTEIGSKLSYITLNINIIPVVNSDINLNLIGCCVFVEGNAGTIEYCINNSDLYYNANSNIATEIEFGIFTWINSGEIKNCVNNGNIILDVNSQTNVNISCFTLLYNNLISNCINNGDIIINGIPAHSQISCFANLNGEVSNCINTGNIYAKKTDVVGVFANAGSYISNCLNTGNLTGETIAGGIVGKINFRQLDNCIIENCLNAGSIYGDSLVGGIVAEFDDSLPLSNPSPALCIIRNNIDLSKTSKYALFGQRTENINAPYSLIVENNFYDKQMVTISATPSGDVAGVAEGKLTTEITGFALQSILGDGWSYAEGRYPIPLGLENHPAVLLAATPVYLHATDTENFNTVDSVTENFTLGLGNNTEWHTANNNVSLYGENSILQNTGYETLTGRLDNYSKNIYLNIKAISNQTLYTVSGNITIDGNPLSDVRILYSNTFTTTDQNGNYFFDIPANTNATLTPTLAGYSFMPANIELQNITQNYTNQDFTARFIDNGITPASLGKLVIYPNPAKDELFIFSENVIYKVKISNLTGHVLITERGTATINLSGLNTGVYLIKIYTNRGIAVQKILKK